MLHAKLKLKDIDIELHGEELVCWLSDLLFAVQYQFANVIRLDAE